MQDVQIESVDRRGKQLWQVRLGRRCVTFAQEQAARAFAAQLHLRVHWLHQQSDDLDSSDPTPP
ncbi:hypothetical protein D3880_11405 [Pseudomonas cavernae]|uniref:DUF2188 domain-containing protein n=1 Tax=Pseudomonas cavernae TaxID=2320867 RepID=A0A385Z2E9_9PSED|nr:hypothetical protein [Pseudomonas cavernae]AYC32944.1 hypothetical protein D3880_11405 [Pseudomonas cavernae]